MGKISDDLNIVCVCPVKNEEWIIEFFCESARVWADRIIILDQGSTDSTVDLAAKFDEVIVIDNLSDEFNEAERQEILINQARKIYSLRRLIVALDADEVLGPEFPTVGELDGFLSADPGTVFYFSWLQVLPDMKSAYSVENVPFGYLDDGLAHNPSDIHSVRVPLRERSPRVRIDESKNYHLQLIHMERMKQKQIWYQAYEIYKRNRDPISVFRQYNAYKEFRRRAVTDIPIELKSRIELIVKDVNEFPWWFEDVLRWLKEERSSTLRWADIWDVPWQQYLNNECADEAHISKPRLPHRTLLGLLKATQPYSHMLPVRLMDKILRTVFFTQKNS